VTTPAGILDVLAGTMLVVAAVSAARLVAARPWERGAVVTDTDVSHLLTGIAMAGMLASTRTTLPDAVWMAAFSVLAVWFGCRVVRDCQASGARALAAGRCAPHLVHSAAMLYMFAAQGARAAGGAVSGMATPHIPTLAFLFALVLIGYTIWDLDRLPGLRRGLATVREHNHSSSSGRRDLMTVLDSRGTMVGGRVAMGVAMALMLILMPLPDHPFRYHATFRLNQPAEAPIGGCARWPASGSGIVR
jgi:hypothetical protein